MLPMTHSLLNDCLLIYHKGEDTYRVEIPLYLSETAIQVFDPLLSYEPSFAAQAIVFILCAFSEESPMVVSRQDAVQEKEQVCDYLGITDPLRRESLVYLKDDVVRGCVADYLVHFCGEEFRSYMFMRMQLADYTYDIARRMYREEEIEATGDEDKPTRIVYHYDQKEHNKAVMERDKLAKLIEKAEKAMYQKIKKVGITSLEDWKRRGGNGGSARKRTADPERFVKNRDK